MSFLLSVEVMVSNEMTKNTKDKIAKICQILKAHKI